MPDYKGMYISLFNAITDTLNILQAATTKTEEEYIQNPDAVLELKSHLKGSTAYRKENS